MPNFETIVILIALAYPLELFLWVCWLIVITTVNGGWEKAREYNPDDIHRIRMQGPF